MELSRRLALKSIANSGLVISTLGLSGATEAAMADETRPLIVTDGTSKATRNIEVFLKQNALYNKSDLKGAIALHAKDATNFGHPVGPEGFMRVLTDIYTTFPDWTSHPVEIRAVKDTLVHRSIVTGTHKGMGTLPVNGGLLVGVPPTGKSFSTMHIHTLTFEDGYIKDHWATRDDIKMMQDLGLLPQSPTFG